MSISKAILTLIFLLLTCVFKDDVIGFSFDSIFYQC